MRFRCSWAERAAKLSPPLWGRTSVPDASAARRDRGGVCRDGGLDAVHLTGLDRRGSRLSARRLAYLPSAAARALCCRRQRSVRRLPARRQYRTAARRKREHVFLSAEQAKRLAIIGAGSWGTALSIVLAPRFSDVRLWVYEQDLAGRMRASRENDVYLPGFRLPPNVDVVTGFEAGARRRGNRARGDAPHRARGRAGRCCRSWANRCCWSAQQRASKPGRECASRK